MRSEGGHLGPTGRHGHVQDTMLGEQLDRGWFVSTTISTISTTTTSTCMVTDCMARLVAIGRLLLMIFTGSRRLGLI